MTPPIQVLTHHKCASAWLAGYLDSCAALNGLRLWATPLGAAMPPEGTGIALYGNAAYPSLARHAAGGIHVIRNPLDLVVSAYHSHRNTHPTAGWPGLAAQQRLLREVDEASGMLMTIAFLERADFYEGAAGPLHGLRHWDFDDPGISTLRMEDMVRDAEGTLGALLRARHPGIILPPAERHSFQALTGRQPGEVDATSHYRSGQPGQWRHALPAPAVAYLRAHLEPLLRRFYPATLGDDWARQ